MKKLLFIFSIVIICVFSAMGQKAKPSPTATPRAGDDDSAGTVKTFEVRLPVTVTEKNKSKGFVSGFTKNDFVILEDGVPQEATFFSDEKTNPPVFVGVLMDTSPSTAGKLSFEKQAAKDFLYDVLQLRKDKGAFMTFDNEINLRQDFTDKQDLLSKAVENVKKTGSQTALFDAVYKFCDEKLRNAPGRRVVVVITDGDDTFSRAELSDAVDIAQRTETTVFAISTKAGFLGSVPGVEGGTAKDAGDKLLTRMTSETGGDVFFSGNLLDLDKSFTKISKELRSQYIITYRPANQEYDGRQRKIEVRFRDPDKAKLYKIRTKTEYRKIRDDLK
jgi:Ca-activated chloride channel homolog